MFHVPKPTCDCVGHTFMFCFKDNISREFVSIEQFELGAILEIHNKSFGGLKINIKKPVNKEKYNKPLITTCIHQAFDLSKSKKKR